MKVHLYGEIIMGFYVSLCQKVGCTEKECSFMTQNPRKVTCKNCLKIHKERRLQKKPPIFRKSRA